MDLAPQTSFLQANGLAFRIGIAGAGPRLLFLTGSNGDLRRVNSPLRSPLVESFRVLSYDQRGLGQSSKPDRPYAMRDYAEDAVAILDALGWDRVHLLGYSFGGMVAQELAIGWPERIDRLVLCATTAGGRGGSSYPIQDFASMPPRRRAQASLEVADLSFTPDWQAQNPEASDARIARQIERDSMFADEPAVEIGRTRQLAARAQHDTFDRLHSIQAETLVLAGSLDGQAPSAAQRAMADRIPGAIYGEIRGSHAMIWETMECFDRALAFLGQDQSCDRLAMP